MKPLIVILLAAISIGCGYSHSTTPQQPGTMPTISQLKPNNGNPGAQIALEVDGSNFAGNAVINFNGAAQATTWTNSGKVTATITIASSATPGSVPVTVTNPGTAGGQYGGGTAAATSQPMNFTVN